MLDLNKKKYCFVVSNNKEKDFINKIKLYSKNINVDIVEFRIDFLYNEYKNIDKIISIINKSIQILNNKKTICTLRTKADGSDCLVSGKDYLAIIKKIYYETKIDSIDIEYRFYKKYKNDFDDILKTNKKTIILSYHDFNKRFNKKKYEQLLIDMINYKKNVVKIAILTYNEEEVFDMMSIARNLKSKLSKNQHFTIISMGKCGIISRILADLTYSKIMYVHNDLHNINNFGNMNYKTYQKLIKFIKQYN